MKNVIYTASCICLTGLVACAQIDSPTTTSAKDPITIKLTNNDGTLEYCDANGECTRLPYDGDCAVVEVDIDPATGGTCERCVRADGTVTDLGCAGTSVGCVLVTLPDPDCVVCAYINGAIIYSTCVEQHEQPQCYVDSDCRDDNGMGGFCFDGNCVYEPGCRENADCPAGFFCEYMGYPEPSVPTERPDSGDPSDSDESPANDWYGTCVPHAVSCFADGDCPRGMYCESWCYGVDPVAAPCENGERCPEGFACNNGMCEPACDNGTECPPPVAPPNCEGVCRPYYENPCENVECPAGMHCEAYEVQCVVAPCPPIAQCIPDYRECRYDNDCPDGFACIIEVCPAMPCDADGYCPPCYGICEPAEPENCYSDEECAPGEVCEFHYDQVVECYPDGSCDDPWAPGMCVPAPVRCENDGDCGELGLCVQGVCVFQFDCDMNRAYCDMMPPICPDGQVLTVVNGCYGPCVDPHMCEPAQQGCTYNEECPPLHECMVYCWACPQDPSGAPNPDCIGGGCEGVCVPFEPYCQFDEECYDAAGNMGSCENGMCTFDIITCDDTTCPEGMVCEEVCSSTGCDPDDSNCISPPVECYSICMEPPRDECFRTGCSGEICAERDMASACVYLEEYRCLEVAICERQQDGACGWTATDEAARCLADLGMP